METIHVKIDCVTSDSDGRSWRLVEGPWDPPDSATELARLTKRVADTVTAALNGQHQLALTRPQITPIAQLVARHAAPVEDRRAGWTRDDATKRANRSLRLV